MSGHEERPLDEIPQKWENRGMKHSITKRLLQAVSVSAVLAWGGTLIGASPVAAQQQAQGGRFRVLVVNPTPQNGADKGFGKDVAKQVNKLIDRMDTHQPVDKDDLKKALKKYGLDEEDLDCIKGRQLAVQMDVQLVMCGQYDQSRQITAKFVSAKEGGEFDVPAFQASSSEEAAQRIFQAFQDYVGQLRLVAFCYDYLSSGQFPAALENCSNALAKNPDYVPALYGRARALMEMDSLTQALAGLEKVLEANPAHQDALLTAGVVAAKLNKDEQARKYFRQYLELNPGNVDVRLKVANDLANAGDPEGALRLAQEGGSDSTNLTLTEYIGHFALAAAEDAQQQGADGEQADTAKLNELYNTALDAYREVFQAKGDSADAQMLRNMVSVLTHLDRNQEAVDLAKKVVAVKTDDAQLWYTYAAALNQAGNLTEALSAMEKALQIDPELPNAYALEAQWLIQAGRIGQARQIFDQALSRQKTAQEKQDLSDKLAQVAFITGYKDKYQKQQKDAAIGFFQLAREYATTTNTKGMATFWIGYSYWEQAKAADAPQTAASAKKALPLFQKALDQFQTSEAAAYARTQPSIDISKLISAAKQYIDIEQALIKRG